MVMQDGKVTCFMQIMHVYISNYVQANDVTAFRNTRHPPLGAFDATETKDKPLF